MSALSAEFMAAREQKWRQHRERLITMSELSIKHSCYTARVLRGDEFYRRWGKFQFFY
uniref:UTP--glucose-1-phosphate uridylyltransferase n=1 Tax=Parascaris univalens TaxID=6257 RepID=A0A915APP2_PARUN